MLGQLGKQPQVLLLQMLWRIALGPVAESEEGRLVESFAVQWAFPLWWQLAFWDIIF